MAHTPSGGEGSVVPFKLSSSTWGCVSPPCYWTPVRLFVVSTNRRTLHVSNPPTKPPDSVPGVVTSVFPSDGYAVVQVSVPVSSRVEVKIGDTVRGGSDTLATLVH